MKILLHDPYGGKFTSGMQKWWMENGHEVKYSRYYDPSLVDWADVIWFDTCDNNLASATNPTQALLADDANFKPWDIHEHDLTGKKVIVRPIDIEVWGGGHAASKWDVVDHCIFIAPHIRDMALEDSRMHEGKMQIHTIPHSISPEDWTFRERKLGFNIAVVAEIWESKGIDYVLQIAYKLKAIDPRYHIYYLGKEQDYHWHRFYREEFIRENELPITFITEPVDSVDHFLEDKNYLLHCSSKEAFSAATAEAAAKGIKPVIHAFGGYKPLWGDSGWVWKGIDEAIEMIVSNEYNSQSYLDYLYQKGYNTDKMMERIMKAISG